MASRGEGGGKGEDHAPPLSVKLLLEDGSAGVTMGWRLICLEGDISYGTMACTNWLPARLHHIGAMFHFPTNLAIDSALAADMDTNILGTLSSTGANM